MVKRKKRQFGGEETLFEISDENRGNFTFSDKAHSDKNSETEPGKNRENKKNKKRNIGSDPGEKDAIGLRVIGGKFRGSKLEYAGDNRVRPMKDRVREAVFNLIGPEIKGLHVIDLFGGTGALCIEAISRGAVSATIIEMHLPTAALLRQNLISLNLLDVCNLRKTDAFFWAKYKEEHPVEGPPWIVFCSPPYDFYVKRQSDLLELLDDLLVSAPNGSMFVIESDQRFDFNLLPVKPEPKKIRSYPPAEIAIFYKGEEK